MNSTAPTDASPLRREALRSVLVAIVALEVALGQVGCTSWTAVDADSLPHVPPAPSGSAPRTSGRDTIDGEYKEVRIEATEGWVFMIPPGQRGISQPVREDSKDDAERGGWKQAPDRYDAPVSAEVQGPALVVADDHQPAVVYPLGFVSKIQVKRASEGRTAGLIVGSVAGAAALVALIAVLVTVPFGGAR